MGEKEIFIVPCGKNIILEKGGGAGGQEFQLF